MDSPFPDSKVIMNGCACTFFQLLGHVIQPQEFDWKLQHYNDPSECSYLFQVTAVTLVWVNQDC